MPLTVVYVLVRLVGFDWVCCIAVFVSCSFAFDLVYFVEDRLCLIVCFVAVPSVCFALDFVCLVLYCCWFMRIRLGSELLVFVLLSGTSCLFLFV